MVRLKDVAERSGVSLKTVSNVVNNYKHVSEAMRRRVMKAILETGYVPDESAQRLARGKGADHEAGSAALPSRLRIGCLVRPGINKYDDPFHARILTGIEEEISKTRNIFAFSRSPREFADDPMLINYLSREGTLDGLITFVWHDEVRSFFQSHLPGRIPVCSVNFVPELDSLSIDFRTAIRLVLDHLTALGHRKIGYIGVIDPWYGQPDSRYQAFLEEMRLRHLELVPEWMPGGGDFLAVDSGRQLAERILQAKRRPSAIVCATDLFAIAAIKALRNAGLRIPEDISLTGFDNIALAELIHPALTTIHIDQEAMGRAAVQLLLARIARPDVPPSTHFIHPELIIRESTGTINDK